MYCSANNSYCCKVSSELCYNDTNYLYNYTGPLSCTSLENDANLKVALIVACVVTGIVMVAGGLGNLLTLCCFLHQKCLPGSHRSVNFTPTTILIINLALADFIYCLLCLPPVFFGFVTVLHEQCTCAPLYTNLSEICIFGAFMRLATALTEWITIGLMALERFLAISYYSTGQRPTRLFTPKITVVYCVFAWVVGLSLQLPTLLTTVYKSEPRSLLQSFGYNSDTIKCDFVFCNVNCNEHSDTFDARDLFFMVEAIIPMIFITLCYMSIICTIIRAWRRVRAAGGTSTSRRLLNIRNSRSTMVYMKLVSIFLICVLPMCVWNITVNICNMNNHNTQELGIYLYCLYWLQYMLNNFVYVIACEKYRTAYKQFLRFLLGKELKRPNMSQILYARKSVPATVFVIHSCYQEYISSSNSDEASGWSLNTSSIGDNPILYLPKGFWSLSAEERGASLQSLLSSASQFASDSSGNVIVSDCVHFKKKLKEKRSSSCSTLHNKFENSKKKLQRQLSY